MLKLSFSFKAPKGVISLSCCAYLIFIVSGFWHGANWTFIIWGLLNAIYFLPILLTKRNRSNLDVVAKGKHLPSVKEFLSMLLTFSLTVLAWIFFRAENIQEAILYLTEIFSISLFTIPEIRPWLTIFLVIVFLIIEWFGRNQQYAIENLGLKWKPVMRYSVYYAIILAIIWFGGKEQQFIYFQF